MNFKEFLKAMQTIEDDRKITKEIVIAALQEALAKAYRKHIDIPDVLVRVDINAANGPTIYRRRGSRGRGAGSRTGRRQGQGLSAGRFSRS